MFLILLITVISLKTIYGDLLVENLRSESILYGISSIISDGQANYSSSTCLENLRAIYEGANEKKVWALKILDSSGVPGDGFLYGNNLWLGSESQCRDVTNRREFELYYNERPLQEGDFPDFQLDFQIAYLNHNSTLQKHTRLPLEYVIQIGLCVPAECSTGQIAEVLRDYVKRNFLTVQKLYELNLGVEYVRIVENEVFWIFSLPKTILFFVIFGCAIFLAILGTVYDEARKRRDESTFEINQNEKTSTEFNSSLAASILKCFNFKENVKALFRTKKSPDTVTFIHGIRCWGMLWVILVHATFFISEYLENTPMAYRLSESFLVQPVSNSTYCVDTFFFISGFLVSFLFYKSKKKLIKQQQISVSSSVKDFFLMVLNRFLRLTPAYAISLLLANVMYTFYAKKSVLRTSEDVGALCDRYWWRNFLYINNLFPRKEMCLSWSWYLSNDMQFFVVSTGILLLSTLMFKLALSIFLLLITICVTCTALQAYHIEYIPFMDQQLVELDAIYDLPWNRMGPYLIGILTGYFLQMKLTDKQLVLKKCTKIFLWTFFPLINLYIVYGLYTREVSIEYSAVYMGLSRTLWGIGIAWLVIACYTNNAGILNDFLSFGGFIPFSRLAYSAYLLNPIVTKFLMWTSDSSFNYSYGLSTMTFGATTFWTFFFAFFFSILFESPFILLTKVLLRKETVKRPNLDEQSTKV